jgi:predicted kinase
MDMRARSLPGLANVAMNHYWDATRQGEDSLALLPFFMALRAAVRMAVSVEAGDFHAAQDFRTLAADLLRPPAPLLLAVGGLSGTGKSTLAERLAPRLAGPCGARWLRSDAIRKELAGAEATARLAGASYSAGASEAVYRALAGRSGAALAAGCSVVADATFRDASARRVIEAAAKAEHRPFCAFWLRARLATRLKRVGGRHNDLSDATQDVARAQREPDDLASAWRILEADVGVAQLSERAAAALPEEAQ